MDAENTQVQMKQTETIEQPAEQKRKHHWMIATTSTYKNAENKTLTIIDNMVAETDDVLVTGKVLHGAYIGITQKNITQFNLPADSLVHYAVMSISYMGLATDAEFADMDQSIDAEEIQVDEPTKEPVDAPAAE